MTFETILYEVKDKICTITLNRPENMNSYNNTMSAEINQALKMANEDDGVRAVIFTGAEGCKKPTFCAGFDLTGAMVDAAHEIGVAAPIYITTGFCVLDAQQHPENYMDLIVRLWGVSAHFVLLPRELQDELIARMS